MENINKSYLNISELSEYSGISVRTLWDFLKGSNPIPHFRIGESGRIVRVRKSDFDQWIETYRVNPESKVDKIVEDISKSMGI